MKTLTQTKPESDMAKQETISYAPKPGPLEEVYTKFLRWFYKQVDIAIANKQNIILSHTIVRIGETYQLMATVYRFPSKETISTYGNHVTPEEGYEDMHSAMKALRKYIAMYGRERVSYAIVPFPGVMRDRYFLSAVGI